MFGALKFNLPLHSSTEDFNFEPCFERFCNKKKIALFGSLKKADSSLNDEEKKQHIENWKTEFANFSWEKKVDKDCDEDEILEIINIIEEFYRQI